MGEKMSQKYNQIPNQREHYMPDQEYLTLMFMFSKSDHCGKKKKKVEVQTKSSFRVTKWLLQQPKLEMMGSKWGHAILEKATRTRI